MPIFDVGYRSGPYWYSGTRVVSARDYEEAAIKVRNEISKRSLPLLESGNIDVTISVREKDNVQS